MSHEVETLVLTDNQPAWHKLGVVLPNKALYSDEVLRYAGLEWHVDKKELFTRYMEPDGPVWVPVDGWKANVRDSDGKVVGVMSDDYKLVQPDDMTRALDQLVQSGEAFYKTAGSLKSGRIIFFLVQPPEDCWIAGEQHEQYICGRTSFDGSSSTSFKSTMTRVVCKNTFDGMVLGAGREITFKHVGDMNAQVEEARRVLGLARVGWQKMADNAEKLAMEKFSDSQFEKFITRLVPANPNSKRSVAIATNKREKILTIYRDSPNLGNIRGTAWGALNAVVDFDNHHVNRRATKLNSRDAQRTQSILFTKGLPHRAAALLRG